MTAMDMQQSLRSSLAKRQKEQPQNRVSDQLNSSLAIESWLREQRKAAILVLPRTPLSLQQEKSITLRRRQQAPRSGLPRLRCCECHLHHKRSINSFAAVREFCKAFLQQVCHCKVVMSLLEIQTKCYTSKNTKVCRNPRLHSCDEKCNVRSVRDTHLSGGFTLIVRLSFTLQMILNVALWVSFHGEGQSDRRPRENVVGISWRSVIKFAWANMRQKRKITDDNSRERGVESQLWAAAQRGYPEDATGPMVAPQDDDIRQSWSVLELQNRDHGYDQQFCPGTFTSSRPFVKNLSTPIVQGHPRNWKAKEDKIEEAKKQKIKRSDDEWNYADWQPSSWSRQQPMTWTSMTWTSSSSSSWQQWSSDQTRERSDWQPSADWSSSDQTRERSGWRPSGFWQSPFSWQWRRGTSPAKTFSRASMTTKITSGCDGGPSFRFFCHLFCVVLFCCEQLS